MTPQLLVSSGIGEGGKVSDLPGVGKNLQDHPVVGVIFKVDAETAQLAPSVYTISEQLREYGIKVGKWCLLGVGGMEWSGLYRRIIAT